MAVCAFISKVGPYSAESRRYSIYRLLTEVIDPAVQAYLDSLPKGHLGLAVGIPGFNSEMGIGELCHVCGFDVVHRMMKDRLRVYVDLPLGDHGDASFFATVETLIDLVDASGAKQPKNVQRGGRPFCELCGNKTELASCLDGGDYPDLKLKLSSQYCVRHKPKANNDPESNKVYKRAIRSKDEFEEECLRMLRQASNLSMPLLSQSGDILVDLYMWNYIVRNDMRKYEESTIRNHARNMVDSNITDQKKRILMLLKLGKKQADIARHLMISRPAVSKAIKLIPDEYRLYVKQTSDHAHKQVISELEFDMGEVLLKALQDPMVVKVMRDPDGKIWQAKYGEPIKHIGYLGSIQAQAIIEALAEHNGKRVSRQEHTFEGEFMFDGRRYDMAGLLPPVVSSPRFAIIKRAGFVISPEMNLDILEKHRSSMH